jgi:PAS domain S-box-containing protein/putative nucleotidyltransferase with HDIG domain
LHFQASDSLRRWDVYEYVSFGVVIRDALGEIIYANSAACDILKGRLIEKDGTVLSKEKWLFAQEEVDSTKVVGWISAEGGQVHWLSLRSRKITEENNEPSLFITSITELDTEQRLSRINRALKVLSESNQALVRAKQELELLEEICRTVAEVGGYPLAWVGYSEPGQPLGVRPVAKAGPDAALLDSIHESMERYDNPKTAFAKMFSSEEHQVFQNLVLDLPAIALPLIDNGQVFGLLMIHSEGIEVFDHEEISLLNELVNDLSYGILSLRAREERKRSREKLHFMQFSIDHATDAIFWIDAEAKFFYVNQAACQTLGFSHDELLTMDIFQVNPYFSKEVWSKNWRQLKSMGSLTFESCYRTKEGCDLPVEVTCDYLEYNGKEYCCAFVRDIRERKRVVEALRESEEKFRSLVESTSDFFWEIDRNERYTYVSPKITSLIGYRPEEVLGMTPFDLMPKMEAERFAEKFRVITAEEAPFGSLENILVHSDGHLIMVETSGLPIYDEQGVFRGYRGIDRDVTERKRAESELTLSLEKLSHSIESAVEAMALTVEMKDPYTAGHQRRVALLACAIAKELNLPDKLIDGLRLAAVVHDIGKIYVPAEILSKPGKITGIEFSLIKTHPKVGFDVLKTIEFPWPVAQIVLQHHERLNGKGYPVGLAAEEILLEAKILSVADVVEAMSSHRPYRPALGRNLALEEIIQQSGVAYDPDVVDACLRLFNEKGFSFNEF